MLFLQTRWVQSEGFGIDINHTIGYTISINGGYKMPNVKTAISIEKPIFEKMDILAKNLKISRSRLFSMAAQEFIERHRNLELLKSLNQAYEDAPKSEPAVTQMRSRHYKLVKDQW
jgi:antitoxin MazE6